MEPLRVPHLQEPGAKVCPRGTRYIRTRLLDVDMAGTAAAGRPRRGPVFG
jgi:hypothetical protein